MPPKLGRSVLVDKREGGWVRNNVLLGRTARVQASWPGKEERNETVNANFEAYVNESNYIIIHLTQFALFVLIWPLNELLVPRTSLAKKSQNDSA
jgi:hypothetical protein